MAISLTISDEILDLMKRKRKLKLTATDIAEILHWEDKVHQQRVKAGCLELYEQGKLVRCGTGRPPHPHRYSMPRREGHSG